MIALSLPSARAAFLVCGVTWVAAAVAAAGQRGPGLNALIQRPGLNALVSRQPMIFFLVKGRPDACGRGCSEWIAAEGHFDLGSAQRLADFLALLEGRSLPIFFNSQGGYDSQAQLIGRILRVRRMTAGVGRTIPEGCRGAVATDESCRRLIRSRSESKAQLRGTDASCSSACVYALIGASVRRLVIDSRIGIHASRIDPEALGTEDAPKLEDVYLSSRRCVLEMGVDPGLVDAAAKVSPTRVHYLTRDEIAKFGIEIQNSYETRWMSHRDPSGQRFALKSITQGKGADANELRTTNIRLWCAGPGLGVWFAYRRELPTKEMDVPTSIRVAAGGREFMLGLGTKGPYDHRSAIADQDFLQAATAASNILITETFSPYDAENWSRQIKLSTDGLAKTLDEVQRDCSWPKFLSPIGASVGR